MLEALAGIGAFVFFWTVRDISELGFVITSPFFYPWIMIIRVFSSTLGFFAAFFRRVKLTKFYFALLSFNIPMTFLACVPLWRCKCECDRHDYFAMTSSRKQYADPDCRVLRGFVGFTPSVRRLLAETASEPATRSHAMAVANAVVDTVGALSTNTSSLYSWQAAAMRALFNIRYFFSLASTPPRAPSPRQLPSNRSSLLRRRLLENSSLQRRTSAVQVNADQGESRGRSLSAERRLKLQYHILYYFDVTQAGIGWRSEHSDPPACDPPTHTAVTQAQIRSQMRKMWTWASDEEGFKDFDKKCKQNWCERLTIALEKCIDDEECGVVQAESFTELVEMAPDMDGIISEEEVDLLKTCQYNIPIFPLLLPEENQIGNLFFQKKETVTMKAILLNQMEEDSASDKCYAVVTLVMMSLLFLDVISVPMFVIVQKFLMRRCGDFLLRERQFTVEFSSEEEDSEDDFTIGSGNSSAWMAGNPNRKGTQGTDASSFASLREGENSFSPGSGGSKPRKEQSKDSLPGHWKSAPKPGSSADGVELASSRQMDSTVTLPSREAADDNIQAPTSPTKKKGAPTQSMYSWG